MWDFVGTCRNRCRNCCKFVGTVGTIESGCFCIPRLDRSYGSYKFAAVPTAVPTVPTGKAEIQRRRPHIGMRTPHRMEAAQSARAPTPTLEMAGTAPRRTHLPQPPMKLNFLLPLPPSPLCAKLDRRTGVQEEIEKEPSSTLHVGGAGGVEHILQN